MKAINIYENKVVIESNLYTSRIYGAHEIHKDRAPIRHIVNTIGGPTYHLTKYLAEN